MILHISNYDDGDSGGGGDGDIISLCLWEYLFLHLDIIHACNRITPTPKKHSSFSSFSWTWYNTEWILMAHRKWRTSVWFVGNNQTKWKNHKIIRKIFFSVFRSVHLNRKFEILFSVNFSPSLPIKFTFLLWKRCITVDSTFTSMDYTISLKTEYSTYKYLIRFCWTGEKNCLWHKKTTTATNVIFRRRTNKWILMRWLVNV